MRVLKYFVLVLILIVGGTVLSIYYLNSRDLKLEPSVEAEIRRFISPTLNQKRALYHLLGLMRGETKRPMLIGVEWFKKFQGLSKAEKLKHLNGPVISDQTLRINFTGCDSSTRFCSFLEVEKNEKILQLLNSHQGLIESYGALLQTGGVRTFEPGLPNLQATGLTLHRLFLLKMTELAASNRTVEALNWITVANRYLADSMRMGSALNSLICANAMEENANFLIHIKTQGAKFRLSEELRKSFVLPSATDAFKGEITTGIKMLNTLFALPMTIEGLQLSQLNSGEDANSKTWYRTLSVDWILRRNETLNMYLRLANESLLSTCEVEEPFQLENCLSSASELDWKSPKNWLINPAGRILLRMILPPFPKYRQTWLSTHENIQSMLDKI